MGIAIRPVTIEDYDGIYELWNSTEQSRRALNPVDDSREGIGRYLKRNPTTCFLAESKDGSGDAPEIVGVILTGHDGRRAIVHHLCVHPSYRREGIAGTLVRKAEEDAEKIRAAANAEHDEIIKNAQKEGYDKGHEEGYNTGKEGDPAITVIGVDATDAAMEAIKAGRMTATVKQDGDAMGEANIRFAMNWLLNGTWYEGLEDMYKLNDDGCSVYIPYAKITAESLAD